MDVETVAAGDVRAAIEAIERAHQRVSRDIPDSRQSGDDPAYWEGILEANAAAVLAALDRVGLPEGYAVRYRFFERSDDELRVRPFVARETTDVSAVRAALEWHPAPDSGPAALWLRASRDGDLLYRHFSFTPDALGVFHYWLAVQEIWASATWVHTRVVAGREHFAEIVATGDWQVERQVESYQPVVVRRDGAANLALLLYSPLQRHSIALQQVEIRADQSVVYGETIQVAAGPRGYL